MNVKADHTEHPLPPVVSMGLRNTGFVLVNGDVMRDGLDKTVVGEENTAIGSRGRGGVAAMAIRSSDQGSGSGDASASLDGA
ncbi:hypothetical protein ACFXO9_31670 [Nocardia tengchongensis]|uniref:hypothetical protein n=1 Tax=Nocardia tengchongensis TaxID=2055889 RepID=UPI00367FA8CF